MSKIVNVMFREAADGAILAVLPTLPASATKVVVHTADGFRGGETEQFIRDETTPASLNEPAVQALKERLEELYSATVAVLDRWPSLVLAGDTVWYGREDLDPEFAEALVECGGQGDMEFNVAHVRDRFLIVGDEDDCRRYLASYGAWDDDDLEDHSDNLQRLVWLAGCTLAEDQCIYFERSRL